MPTFDKIRLVFDLCHFSRDSYSDYCHSENKRLNHQLDQMNYHLRLNFDFVRYKVQNNK